MRLLALASVVAVAGCSSTGPARTTYEVYRVDGFEAPQFIFRQGGGIDSTVHQIAVYTRKHADGVATPVAGIGYALFTFSGTVPPYATVPYEGEIRQTSDGTAQPDRLRIAAPGHLSSPVRVCPVVGRAEAAVCWE